jgi:hypothetical protein
MKVRREGVARLVKSAVGEAITSGDKTAYMDKNGIVRVRKASASVQTATKVRTTLLGMFMILAGKNSRIIGSSKPDALQKNLQGFISKLCALGISADLVRQVYEGRGSEFTGLKVMLEKALSAQELSEAKSRLATLLNGGEITVGGKSAKVEIPADCKEALRVLA